MKIIYSDCNKKINDIENQNHLPNICEFKI